MTVIPPHVSNIFASLLLVIRKHYFRNGAVWLCLSAFTFKAQRHEDGLPRRRLLAKVRLCVMTLLVVRHCERSVAVSGFA